MSPTGRREAEPARPRHILLIRLRRIGDVVMTTPAVALLKSFLPESALTYLIEEPYRRLVEGLPAVDRVLAVPAKQDRRAFFGLLRQVRRERFDAVLDFHGGPRASWITAFSGAKLKVGYALRGKSFLYDRAVPRQPERGVRHSAQSHAELVRALGFEFNDAALPAYQLPEATAEEKTRVGAVMAEFGLADKKYAVLHVGAGNAFRDWGSENHAVLAAALARRPDFKVALIGGPGDLTRQEEVITGAAAGGRVAGLAGRLNLIETRALVARAALFVGPDSGPMHIAASTPTPIVALFGPTEIAHFAPWRTEGRAILIQKDMDCRPCPQRVCVSADYRCLRTITPAEVAAAGEKLIGVQYT
ncbi:MAG: glycosyltransferase family 9 protein [Candidatus Aminicenantes bacterium]|nr:glycosyltransferase family 9 protein [Candidatus Aminicenantes bacterium]